MITPPITLVTADKVPTLPVLACTKPLIFVLFATINDSPPPSTPVPVMFRLAMFAVPSTRRPKAPAGFAVVFAARIWPETVRIF